MESVILFDIGWGNSLLPVRCQTITLTNIALFETNINDIVNQIQIFNNNEDKKYISIFHLQNVRHFVQATVCYTSAISTVTYIIDNIQQFLDVQTKIYFYLLDTQVA